MSIIQFLDSPVQRQGIVQIATIFGDMELLSPVFILCSQCQTLFLCDLSQVEMCLLLALALSLLRYSLFYKNAFFNDLETVGTKCFLGYPPDPIFQYNTFV